MPTPTPAERVAQETARIAGNVADAYTSCNTMGATMPAAADQDSDHLADTILTITGGSPTPTAEEKAVNLYDIDGTLLYSYTKAEALALTELPSTGGTHTGLAFDGWNWQVSSIKSYLTNHPDAVFSVMAQYTVNNSENRFYITIPTNQNLTVRLIFSGGTIIVDWGDGTTTTETGNTSHTYAPTSYPANYVIKATFVSGSIRWGNYNESVLSSNVEIRTMLKRAELSFGSTFSYAFYQCSELETVVLSGTVGVQEKEFYQCYSLKNILINRSTSSLGVSAFYQCYSLKSIVCPDSLNAIYESAFYQCLSITTLTLPDSIQILGNSICANCSSLYQVVLPNSITSIPNQMFSTCMALPSVDIPASVTAINQSAFYQCRSLTSIVIPASVTLIDKYAFNYCYSLKSIVFPNSVTQIGNEAFGGCSSLSSIVIPSSVTTIGTTAFNSCSSLILVDVSAYENSIPSLGSANVFNGTASVLKFAAKSDAMITTFSADTNWSTYAGKFVVKDW